MSIHRVIERLETYVRESTWVPMGYRVVSLERVLELVEKMRSTLPEEVSRARVIAGNKDRMIREAQERAQAIVHQATETHESMIEQSEIVRRARNTADIVLREAEDRARRIREDADAYVSAVLGDLRGRLDVALGSVVKGEEALTKQREKIERTAAAANDRIENGAPIKPLRSKNSRTEVQKAQKANVEIDESFLEKIPLRMK
jgi:uncharacterized coiled-coil DUF342 family protein